MWKRILIVAGSVLLSAAQAQITPTRRPNRRTVLRQLSTDLGTALEHATLKDKDRKKLDQAQVNLQTISELRSLGRTDRDDLKKSLGDIKKRTGSFREQDRKAVLDDLREAHELGLDKGAQRRARPPRARPFPRYPRGPIYY